MRGARDQQRGYTFGTPFRRVTTQETPENVEKCPLFDELIVGSADDDDDDESDRLGGGR
jgi:hypothetical protein